MQLHAEVLCLEHPVTQKSLIVLSPLPRDIWDTLEEHGLDVGLELKLQENYKALGTAGLQPAEDPPC